MPETASPSSVWRSSTRSYTTACSLGTARRGTPLADQNPPYPPARPARDCFRGFNARPPAWCRAVLMLAGGYPPEVGAAGLIVIVRPPHPPSVGTRVMGKVNTP